MATTDLEARRIEADAVSEAGLIRGEGDAAALEIYASAYSVDEEFYAYWRSLQALESALDENSVIFTIVSFAWAGFGATFGPLVLFSLFWKRMTRAGAIAGMLSGGGMVFIWKLVIKPLGGIFGIYELLPAFIVSSIFIIAVSLLTNAPSKEIQDEFERVKKGA